MNTRGEPFEIDGSVHWRGEDCDCLTSPCRICGKGWVHSQGIYEGYVKTCDVCGRPYYNTPPETISPERVRYLEAPLSERHKYLDPTPQ